MNCILRKRMWLAGASLLAILLGSADANAIVFGPGEGDYIIPTTGLYDFRVAGGQGGGDSATPFDSGGDGALVAGELFLTAGTTLDIVAGEGSSGSGRNGSGYGGGGGSFVDPGSLLFAAGGGGGAGFFHGPGSPGVGSSGGPGGPASYGGGGGGGVPEDFPGTYFGGGLPATGGSFPYGGQGAQACFASGGCFPAAGMGGFGGGGGGGYSGGGGGGGAPGGSGSGAGGGGGGYSYVIGGARNAFGITGGNPGFNGYVSIEFVGSWVPEPSTWAMTLTGFAGLGWLARLRRRKLTPA
jgi:hypothetical protein